MPVFNNLDGTTRSEFQIGKTNTIKFRTQNGVVEYAKSDGIYKRLFSEIVDDPTGFPNRTDSTLAYVDGATPSFTINPTSTTFDYYISGRLHSVAAKTATPTIAEGLWFFYLTDAETLIATQTFDDTVIKNAIVACGYWDAANQLWIYKGDERHGLTMDWETHWDLHESFGTTYVSGLGLGSFSIQAGAPTNNAAAQFALAQGVIRDEDIRWALGASATPAVLPVFYRSGTGVWRRQAANNIPTVYNGATGLLRYNQYTGGAWQQTDVSSNQFVVMHVFATNDPAQPHIVIEGQATYTSATSARTGATTELKSLVTGGLPVVEFSPIASVIYQTNSGWTNNAKHCKVVEESTGVPYVDWRRTFREPSAGGGGTATGDHESLTGLQGGAVSEHYHMTLAQHDAIFAAWLTKTADYTAGANEKIFLDSTSAPFTITLPAAPVIGDYVKLNDAARMCGTNPVTVARNGKEIQGIADDVRIDFDGASFEFRFDGTEWVIDPFFNTTFGQSGIGNDVFSEIANVRLDWNANYSVKLSGKKIVVNGYAVDCSTPKVCNKTDLLIKADGTQDTGAMTYPNFYYMYVSNHLASVPNALRASLTAPTDGYLTANWRYVGDVYLDTFGDASGIFYDTETRRMVRSEYNAVLKSLRSYNSSNYWDFSTGGVWREANNGTGQVRGYFLGDGKNAIQAISKTNLYNGGSGNYMSAAIGYDTTTALTSISSYDYSAYSYETDGVSVLTITPAKGLHYLTQLEKSAASVRGYGGSNDYGTELRTLIPC